MTFNVRRLTAVDMWGANGSLLRRRLILVEFLVGSLAGLAFGVFMLVMSPSWIGTILGLWVIGVALNYVPLALYALAFSRRGALEREMKGVDVLAELHFYTSAQFRVFVPLWIAIIAVQQWRRH